MKLTTDQLISWFSTATVAAGLFPADVESQIRVSFSKVPANERKGLSSGVKQGINDLLAMTSLWLKADVVNAALMAKGLPGLEEMVAQLNRKEDKMLRRGAIKDDEEFYLAKELLDNLESGLTKKQRIKLGQMVHAYEEKARTA